MGLFDQLVKQRLYFIWFIWVLNSSTVSVKFTNGRGLQVALELTLFIINRGNNNKWFLWIHFRLIPKRWVINSAILISRFIPILGRVCVVESCHWNKNVNLYQIRELHDLHNHHQNIFGWRKWTNAGCVPVGWMGNKVVSKQMQIGNLRWTNL